MSVDPKESTATENELAPHVQQYLDLMQTRDKAVTGKNKDEVLAAQLALDTFFGGQPPAQQKDILTFLEQEKTGRSIQLLRDSFHNKISKFMDGVVVVTSVTANKAPPAIENIAHTVAGGARGLVIGLWKGVRGQAA